MGETGTGVPGAATPGRQPPPRGRRRWPARHRDLQLVEIALTWLRAPPWPRCRAARRSRRSRARAPASEHLPLAVGERGQGLRHPAAEAAASPLPRIRGPRARTSSRRLAFEQHVARAVERYEARTRDALASRRLLERCARRRARVQHQRRHLHLRQQADHVDAAGGFDDGRRSGDAETRCKSSNQRIFRGRRPAGTGW